MNFDDACFGQRVKVLKGIYKNQIFKIEAPSNEIKNGVILANNQEKRYIHISCEDLELLSPTLTNQYTAADIRKELPDDIDNYLAQLNSR